jgi:hypothetical protein
MIQIGQPHHHGSGGGLLPRLHIDGRHCARKRRREGACRQGCCGHIYGSLGLGQVGARLIEFGAAGAGAQQIGLCLGACQGGLRSGHLGLGHLDVSGRLLLPGLGNLQGGLGTGQVDGLRRGLKLGQLYRGDL